MKHDYFDDLLVPAVTAASPPMQERQKKGHDKPAPAVTAATAYKSDRLHDESPLAAKLRALGCPIALEVNGEAVCWIVADDEEASRADLDGAVFTAEEAEVLAQFDAQGIRDLITLKARLGGQLTYNGSTINVEKTK